MYDSTGLAYFRHADWLGSSRVASRPNRTMYFSGAYAPYGEDYNKSGTTDLSFTGQNQHTLSGIYDFTYRRYNPVMGRWASPDPAGSAAANPSNPQSWNRYAYVGGNPLGLVDPQGLYPCLAGMEGSGCDLEGGGGWDDSGYCPPWFSSCVNDIGGILGGILGGLEGGGGGSPLPPSGSSGAGAGRPKSPGIHGSWPNGETLGIPNGFPWRPGSIWSVFLPIDPQCEFGPCVVIGFGLAREAAKVGTGVCAAQPELCGLVIITVAGVIVYENRQLIVDTILKVSDTVSEAVRCAEVREKCANECWDDDVKVPKYKGHDTFEYLRKCIHACVEIHGCSE